MSGPLEQLQERLGYRFRAPGRLLEALTHPSYLQEHPEIPQNNQRLEFLGDAVLHLILTDALYLCFPEEREGVLSKRRAALTKGTFLADLARSFGLHEHLRLSLGEESTGGRTRGAALEDALEATIGAIFSDSDFSTTRRTVLAWYGDLSARLSEVESEENPKGRLQEIIQPLHGNEALRYEVTAIEGKDHARNYEVAVYVYARLIGRGRGSSKKLAEENAAREGLTTLAQAKPDAAEPVP